MITGNTGLILNWPSWPDPLYRVNGSMFLNALYNFKQPMQKLKLIQGWRDHWKEAFWCPVNMFIEKMSSMTRSDTISFSISVTVVLEHRTPTWLQPQFL